MLSRIAESLFWLARYIERAEDTARILDVNYHMLLEQSQQSYRLHWEPLIVMAGEEERFRKFYGEANARERLRISGLSPGQSQLDRAVHRQGARKRAHHPRPHFARNVGGHQRPLLHREPLQSRRKRSPRARTASATRSNSAATAFTASPTRRCRTTKAGNFCASAGRSSARK